jgi:hypothetical protein
MSLFSDPTDLNAYGRNLAQLLLIGGVQLENLASGKERVAFKVWAEAIRKDAGKRSVALAEGQTEWLWNTLTTEPTVIRELGLRIVSRAEEWKNQDPVAVLKSGHTLGVFLKPFSSFGSPVMPLPAEAKPQALIILNGVLMMEPGKAAARRFECCDVECVVEIQVEKPGTADQEAVLMKLEPCDVTVTVGRVTACARSLNHAFTVATRRLQPHRRNHGGRAYDHVAWRKGDQWVSLEAIRRNVESDMWTAQ